MSLEIRDMDQERDEPQDLMRATPFNMERLRSSGKRPTAARGRNKISLFWQIFGGTIFSIVAMIVLTAYSQLSNMQTDLRRDVNQLQVDQVKKDEFNARLTALWNSIKELKNAGVSLVSLNEHTKILDGHIGAQFMTGEEQRKDLQRKVEELSQRLQTLAEHLAALEAAERVFKIERDSSFGSESGKR